MNMWIKICGLTRPQDVECCAQAGADAIGINLYTGPRRITTDRAGDILRALPPSVTPVALVESRGGRIDPDLLRFCSDHRIAHLQLYGPITPRLIRALRESGFQPVVTCPVSGADFASTGSCAWRDPGGSHLPWAVLLDVHDPDRAGGTGRSFRWDWVCRARDTGQLQDWPRLVLAGGLHPGNVARALQTVRPFGVDVCTGVESEPGIKDGARVRAFVDAVRQAEGDLGPAEPAD